MHRPCFLLPDLVTSRFTGVSLPEASSRCTWLGHDLAKGGGGVTVTNASVGLAGPCASGHRPNDVHVDLILSLLAGREDGQRPFLRGVGAAHDRGAVGRLQPKHVGADA